MRKFKKRENVKRISALILCFALIFSLAACGDDSERKSFGGSDTSEETTETSEQEVFSDDALEIQEDFEEYLDDYFEEYATSDTLTYNYTLKDGQAYGLEEPGVTLGDPDMSEEAIAEEEEEFNESFEELKAIDRECLTEDQQLTYDILYEYYEVTSQVYDNVYLYEPFSPMRGLQANIATYFTDYRFDDEGDVERYIELLYLIPDYFQGYLDFEKVKSEKGYFMSDEVCEEVIEQCETFLEYEDEHFMVTVFNDNIDELDFLDDEQKEYYKEQNVDAVLNGLLPAFENTIEVMTELKGTGTNDMGLCYYNGGEEYYEYLLQYYTGTSKTADEVIEMLDTELEELLTELYGVYFTNPEAYEYFVNNYDSLFSSADDMTATEIVDTLMECASENYPDFGTINYTAKELDESLETIMENVLAYYMSPAIDDEDNNLIRVNGLYSDDMWTTLAHEGYPGHMLQNAYFMSTDPEPVRTTMNFLGYMEGWAMYACYDALNYYDYDEPSYSEELATLYRINDEMGYLVMGRIDLGINYEGWTVEETAAYLDENGFDSSSVEEVYYTMAGDPAVYQSYSTGYYELKELKEYAEEKMGSSFDIKEFNTIILETGPCQFDILKEQIDKKLIDNVINEVI